MTKPIFALALFTTTYACTPLPGPARPPQVLEQAPPPADALLSAAADSDASAGSDASGDAAGPPRLAAYFLRRDTTDPEKCPVGWHELAYTRGRLILGTTDPARAGTVRGAPIDPTRPLLHGHLAEVSLTMTATPEKLRWANSGTEVSRTFKPFIHSHTADADSKIPIMQMNICAEDEASDLPDALPLDTVSFVVGKACPAGWTPFPQLDGRFPVPLVVGGTRLAAVSPAWTTGPTTHQHAVDIKFFVDEMGVDNWNWVGEFPYVRASGGQVVGTTTALSFWRHDPALMLAPHVELLACIRGGRPVRLRELSPHLTIFTATAECSDRWETAPASAGRFLLGLPEGGEPMATFNSPLGDREDRAHTHNYSWLVDFERQPVWPNPGREIVDLAPPRRQPFTQPVEAAGLGLPYLQLRHCSLKRTPK